MGGAGCLLKTLLFVVHCPLGWVACMSGAGEHMAVRWQVLTLLCWMASSDFKPGIHLSPHCWLIFAWGSFTHFARRRWKGGFLAVAGKSEAGWLPAGPASVTFGAQLAAGAPDSADRRYGGLALAVSGALNQEPPNPAASYTLGT